MTVTEALKSVQFVVDNEGQHTAVLLNIHAWEALISWIEDIADTEIAVQALAELQASGAHPEQAGWLAWDNIRDEWDDEEAKPDTSPL